MREDWPGVADLAQRFAWVRPSFGLHPWYVKERGPRWRDELSNWLDVFPDAAVGEIGLDRWIADPDLEAQVECFRWQLELAASRNRPATIHCLRAWGLLEEQLRTCARPERGFLLHSYGGSADLVPRFAGMGAYFSLSPYFCHERKSAQREVFRCVPAARLLAETDAPDMWPPGTLNRHPLSGPDGKSLNHPANLIVSYETLAELRGTPLDQLAAQIEANYCRLFGASPAAM